MSTNSRSNGESPTCVVVGAGVIGVSIALALQKRGHKVTLIDRKGIGLETSWGNAGCFAFTEIFPLASPHTMRKAPRWFFDPDGPFSIPPNYTFNIAPWLARFALASRPAQFERSISAQAALMQLSRTALEDVITDTEGESLVRREGQIQVYEGRAEFDAAKPERDAKEKLGIDFTPLLSPDAIATVQPGLSRQFTHGVFVPGWISAIDPYLWVRHLADRFVELGGKFVEAECDGVEETDDGVRVQAGSKTYQADHLVIAAGAWSNRLVGQVSKNVPLETERGYNATIQNAGIDLRTKITFSGHGFIVGRVGDDVRVGGGVELGGLGNPPRFARAKAMLHKAKSFLPDLRIDDHKLWMGFRPSFPDTLPAIGPLRPQSRIICAFGHGHLGLTQSAGTAQLVAEIIAGEPPAIPIHPYRIDRF